MNLPKQESRQLKAFVINRLRRMERQQKDFFQRLENKNDLDDYLTVEEIQKEFGISRSTFNRYKLKGLKILQNGYKNKITIKKGDYIEFIKNEKK